MTTPPLAESDQAAEGVTVEPPYVRPATVKVNIGGRLVEFPNPEPTFQPTTRFPSTYCPGCGHDWSAEAPRSHRRAWLCVGCDTDRGRPTAADQPDTYRLDPATGVNWALEPLPAPESREDVAVASLRKGSGPALLAGLLAGAGWEAAAVRSRGPWPDRLAPKGHRIADAVSVRGRSASGHAVAVLWVASPAGPMKEQLCRLCLAGDRWRDIDLDAVKATLRAIALPPAPKTAAAPARKRPQRAASAPLTAPEAILRPEAQADDSEAATAAVAQVPAVVESGAVLSPCGRYRYSLLRRWAEGPAATFVMLNPSTADADQDDPTIRRCIGFARSWGCGALRVVNLYAYRSTDPKALLTCLDPVGPENDDWLSRYAQAAMESRSPLIAAWGVNAQPDRVRQVLGLPGLVALQAIGVTKDGHPRHPLYVRADAAPMAWPAQDAAA